MKNYTQFLTERVNQKQQRILDSVINYVKTYAEEDLYPYEEEFQVTKAGEPILTGKLYLTERGKAVRFNFTPEFLHSVDYWNAFEFTPQICNQPDWTLEINTSVVSATLDDIVDFVNGEGLMTEAVKKEAGSAPPVKVVKAVTEDVKLKSITINKDVLNLNIDVFDAMEMYVRQVAAKVSNALVISGGAGLGKSWEVIATLDDMRIPYETYKGDVSVAGLYETLFINRHKLIVFDDIDAVWDKEESINLLKAALDTYKVRQISRMMKTYFDSSKMTDKEIQAEFEKTGKMPKQFGFDGQVIFITNKEGKEIDPAVISRCLHVDIDLTREEVLDRMRKILSKMFPNLGMQLKEETLEFLDYLVHNYATKFPLNIRTLIHAINIRVANDFKKMVGTESLPMWQLLIKQYLLDKSSLRK